jgi:maltooligosyltrehalose trehalohydrolase
MPFGAELMDGGGVRFRLWAPAARRVDLCWECRGEARLQAMAPLSDGWVGLETRNAGPGTLYRFRIDGDQRVPDPASRFQPQGVHGPSEVIDPAAFDWQDAEWKGRPWEEAVIYELHVGAFSPEGTYRGVIDRLAYLVDLGVTAIELMPVGAFPGRRGWGYDGVLPFAPAASYGRPEDLKALIQAAHLKGLMVFLDVVYNHFGPEGNYLHLYAPAFFTERHRTPWGAAIDFDGRDSRTVRDFFIQNALYWLDEYRLDGLRLDAVHAIPDDSIPHILVELADAVRAGPRRERRVHLVLENDANCARLLERDPQGSPLHYVAQWNDDLHHALHVPLAGERDGYYADYADGPASHLARSLAEGFAYQGEPSAFRGGVARGEPSAQLPPTAFVGFLQNHDQVGNRAFGERIDALSDPRAGCAALTLLLLAPCVPLLFMGQELRAESPFLFFCDFGDDLAQSVTQGRRREFARFERFSDPVARDAIPDPNDPDSFLRSKIDWQTLGDAQSQARLGLHRQLLALRRREIVPRLAGIRGGLARWRPIGGRAIWVRWSLGDGSALTLIANLAEESVQMEAASVPAVPPFHTEPETAPADLAAHRLGPWTVLWFLEPVAQPA